MGRCLDPRLLLRPLGADLLDVSALVFALVSVFSNVNVGTAFDVADARTCPKVEAIACPAWVTRCAVGSLPIRL